MPNVTKGRPKVWKTKKSMVDAGVDFVLETGRRPSVSEFSSRNTTNVPRPSALTIKNAAWFEGSFSGYVACVGRAYKRATGEDMPAPRKGGRKPNPKLDDLMQTPSVLDAPKKRGRPLGSKNKPKVVPVVDTSPNISDLLIKKGFLKSLFGR